MRVLFPAQAFPRIFIDINAPSVVKFKIALSDFLNLTPEQQYPELSPSLPAVISNDLDLSGYFSPIDKQAFLDEDKTAMSVRDIRFRDWTVIGAELLLKGSYACIGNSLEAEVRLFDVYQGKQIMGRRYLGERKDYRRLMHRIGNDVIRLLTGHEGIFTTKLAFVGKASVHKEIYVCDYDGKNVRKVTNDKSIALLPRWSPDGKNLLFTSYRNGKGPALLMKEFSNGSVRSLSSRKGLNIGGCWTPDGSRIALTMSPSGNQDIFIIDRDGKIRERVTDQLGIDVSPAFSPDGTRIAFVSSRSGSPQIYVKELENGREDRLTFEGRYNTSPSWSSTNRIAYVAMNKGNYDIFAIDPDGGGLRRLTGGQGDNEDPCWSPDGRYIVFSSNREGNYHLYMMNSYGRNQRKITYMKGDQTSPSWAR